MINHIYQYDESTALLIDQVPKLSLEKYRLGPNGLVAEINPLVFSHYSFLLGSNLKSFGSDLSLYLATIERFFSSAGVVGQITVYNSTEDYKRRISEDLGVGLSTYIMLEMTKGSITTIAQIPKNKNISQLTPDFQGYSANNSLFIYEAKGTTVLSSIAKQVARARKQVKSYPLATKSKFLCVTYLAGQDDLSTSHTIIADPAADASFILEIKLSRLLHLYHVLSFIGLPKSAKVFLSIVAILAFPKKNIDISWRHRVDDREARLNFISTLNKEIGDMGDGISFDGTWYSRTFNNKTISVILSIHGTIIDSLRKDIIYIYENPMDIDVGVRESESIFYDGTRLSVKFQ
jgi:hypothetical protein